MQMNLATKKNYYKHSCMEHANKKLEFAEQNY